MPQGWYTSRNHLGIAPGHPECLCWQRSNGNSEFCLHLFGNRLAVQGAGEPGPTLGICVKPLEVDFIPLDQEQALPAPVLRVAPGTFLYLTALYNWSFSVGAIRVIPPGQVWLVGHLPPDQENVCGATSQEIQTQWVLPTVAPGCSTECLPAGVINSFPRARMLCRFQVLILLGCETIRVVGSSDQDCWCLH